MRPTPFLAALLAALLAFVLGASLPASAAPEPSALGPPRVTPSEAPETERARQDPDTLALRDLLARRWLALIQSRELRLRSHPPDLVYDPARGLREYSRSQRARWRELAEALRGGVDSPPRRPR